MVDSMTEIERVGEIITRWNLDRNLLADSLGMRLLEFNDKLNPLTSARFNKIEFGLLRSKLIELRSDLSDIKEIEWNVAMKILAKNKSEKIIK